MEKISRLFILSILFSLAGSLLISSESQASSEDACAIWICLPGGFPSAECRPAYSEFKKRIKKGRDPLPKLSGCTTGPNGETTDGNYQLGRETFYPCDEGFVLRESVNQRNLGTCFREFCAPEQFSGETNGYCENYSAIKRPKPNFVKMWVDGQYIGQYFY